MKKMTCVVLMLCIAMMCTTPFEAQSQNRRTGGGNSGNATKKEQPAARSSQSSSTTSPTRTSEPKTKMVTPSGQTQRQSRPASSNTQTTAPKKQNNAPAQVQDRRPSSSNKANSNSHSAQISRKNSEVGRQNIPANRPNKDVKPASKSNNRYNDPYYNRPKDRKPNAVQYHNSLPAHRGPEYARPYLEPKHKPIPAHRYGDHYFGHRINVLPRNYVVMRIGNVDYYYCNGIYYRRYWLGGYYVCRPPRGTAITSTLFNVALTAIAINTIRDEIARARRAAALSTGYGVNKTGYVVRTSDDYYNTNLINQAGQDYYYQDGVFYILKNGQYYVIEPPIGALVTAIPNDYDEVEIEGRTYYQVEDTLYKATVIDGALYFEVVCNL